MGWSSHKGLVTTLPQTNIDTDQLIPARFMSRPRSDGYGDFLLYDVRASNAQHPLNDGSATIVVAGRNFGSGSSREAAVYALVDYGIRAVFAPSFGDIFSGNATNNGLLAGAISERVLDDLIRQGAAEGLVNLLEKTARIGAIEFAFEIDDVSAEKLINGWDDIDMTQQHSETIQQFRSADLEKRPWSNPNQ